MSKIPSWPLFIPPMLLYFRSCGASFYFLKSFFDVVLRLISSQRRGCIENGEMVCYGWRKDLGPGVNRSGREEYHI